MPNWTEQQNNAIEAKNGNILVSAAAGSGKTAVLVQRVIRMLTDENDPVGADRLLILTFTNAAAAEMKSRISSALEELISEHPADISLQRQLSLLSSSKICTVDSFCLNLVRENFFALGVSQDFTVLDDAELAVLTDTALNTVLDRYYEENEAEISALSQLFSAPRDDKAFLNAIKKLHNYIYSQPFPLEWLNSVCDFYDPSVPIEESVWYSYLTDEVNEALNAALEFAKGAYDILDAGDELYDGYFENITDDIRVINDLSAALKKGWDFAVAALGTVNFSRLATKRGYTSPVKDAFKARRDIYKKIVTDEIKAMLCANSEEYSEDMAQLYPVLKTLCRLTADFDAELYALKEERNGYSFADVEHFAIKLLCTNDENGIEPTKLARELQDGFHEILIDEYQDTNDAQDLIYKLLAKADNRFMVGDVKQSIYRFRLAMPHIFVKKRNEYEPYDKSKKGNFKIIFDKNFRSRKGICDFVNFFFSAFMSERVGEIDYNEDEYLNYGADYEESPVPCAQMKIINGVSGENFDSTEAEYIASLIIDKVKKGEMITDKGVSRPVRYGDFAILLRSAKGHISAYNEALTAHGIPVVCDNSSNMFDCNEIKILLSLLRAIDNPTRDIPLLSVMTSPMYGFTPDELAKIRINDKKRGSLYASVLNSDMQKAKDFLKELEMLSKTSVTSSVSYFIRYLCEYKSIYAFVNALGNAEQRCRNIEKFISFAAAFDNSGSVGLTSFLRYIDKVAESDKGIQSAAVNSAAEDAVKIMSIHHSKGLEFPVVILAGAQRKYNTSDLSDKLLLNPFAGVGVKIHNEEKLFDYTTIPYQTLKYLNKTAFQSENLRVLYVAITRAREQFICFNTVKNLESKMKSLSAKINKGAITPYHCRSILSDGDFLLLSALTHKDGESLRALAGCDIDCRGGDFDFDIDIIDAAQPLVLQDEKQAAEYSEDLLDRIKERLSYKYENAQLCSVSAKQTASGLDESVKSLDYTASSMPAFLYDGEMTPAQKGSAMHAFMQFCDYDNAKADIEAEISRLCERSFITPEQAQVLDRKALNTLFSGELARRIFGADKLYREFKISSFVKLKEISDIDSDEEVLIQGISDCVFEENGELVLVDYKTDRVKTGEQLLSMYKNQINFYKNAVSRALGKNVKEALLYSFSLSKVCSYK